MDDIYKSIEEYNPNKRRKTLIVFEDIISDMLSNTKLNPIGTKTKLFSCFYYIILFRCPKIQIQFYTLFCYENFKQKRTSPNCI